MKKIVLICNNLLDISRIREVHGAENVSVYRNFDNLISKFVPDGNRELTILLDYYIYEKMDINVVIKDYLSDFEYEKIVSFVPHEKIKTLLIQEPNIKYIARSKFFYNIEKYLS